MLGCVQNDKWWTKYNIISNIISGLSDVTSPIIIYDKWNTLSSKPKFSRNFFVYQNNILSNTNFSFPPSLCFLYCEPHLPYFKHASYIRWRIHITNRSHFVDVKPNHICVIFGQRVRILSRPRYFVSNTINSYCSPTERKKFHICIEHVVFQLPVF